MIFQMGSGNTIHSVDLCLFVCLFGLMLYVPVNSYGYAGTVSSPNHTFLLGKLSKQLTSTSCTYFRLLLTPTLLELAKGGEWP